MNQNLIIESITKDIRQKASGFLGVVKKQKNENICQRLLLKIKTLLKIIDEYVLKDSIIYTDCWEGYRSVSEFVYTHKTINHSPEFVNSITRVYTNTIREPRIEVKVNTLARHRSKNKIFTFLNLFMFKRNTKSRLFTNLVHLFIN